MLNRSGGAGKGTIPLRGQWRVQIGCGWRKQDGLRSCSLFDICVALEAFRGGHCEAYYGVKAVPPEECYDELHKSGVQRMKKAVSSAGISCAWLDKGQI